MKVLLDENLPVALRHELPGHEVITVKHMKWLGIKNGALLARAAEAGFDVFVTTDRTLPQEQNLVSLPLSIVVLRARGNKFDILRKLMPQLIRTLNHLNPRTVHYVELSK